MSIQNSSRVSIRGKATLNSVKGYQVNNNQAVITEVANFINQREEERTEYDEFESVKRGYIVVIKDLHSENLEKWKWNQGNGQWSGQLLRESKRSICTIRVHPDRQSKYTAMIYEGKDAHAFWEEDFQRFSGSRNATSVQLFGLNRSEIPVLIFHDELVPLGHCYRRSFWGALYVEHLADSQCISCDLWVDSRGYISGGPAGPNFESSPLDSRTDRSILLHSTMNMLKNDTSFQFFNRFRSQALDNNVVECASNFDAFNEYLPRLDELLPNLRLPDLCRCEDYIQLDWWDDYPYLGKLLPDGSCRCLVEMIGGLRFDTVYCSSLEPVAWWPPDGGRLWQCFNVRELFNQTSLRDGSTRFTLDTITGDFTLDSMSSMKFLKAWLAQSSRVISELDLIGKEEVCFAVSPPVLGLKVLHSRGQYAGLVAFFKFCDGEEPPPIYLFIHRYPNTISEVSSWLDECIPTHFWSFDETGQNQMSWDECEEWGLPYLIPYFNDIFGDDDAILETWPTEVYNALREWQIVQGFDPTTADFARHLGYPELEIMSMPKKTNTQSEQAQHKENKPTSSWWEAIAGSGISAFAL